MQGYQGRIAPACGMFSAVILGITAIFAFNPRTAEAVPSFARQTGQPCATCHTAFPELTPYGRAFKLGGYTAVGTRCGDMGLGGSTKDGTGSGAPKETQIPIAVMVNPTFTHIQKDLPGKPAPFYTYNDNAQVQETSVFVAGQIYCNLGAFIQTTYVRADDRIVLDNTDVRYANTTKAAGIDVLYGVTANTSPTVQDVWNTTPVWSFPYTGAEGALAPGGSAATMIEGTFAGRAGGVGGYLWLNRMFYAELTGYASLNNRALTTLGYDPTDGSPRIDGIAPYWRFAFEKTWDEHSLMFGTFGMTADLKPTQEGTPGLLAFPGITDRFTDIGIDTQYQYIGDTHAFTLRGSYIWEKQKLSGEFGAGETSNLKNTLDSLKLSGTYIHNRTYSFTAGYFDVHGSSDALLYGNAINGNGFSNNSSPNTNGWTLDAAYLPFSFGGPKEWPWLNARIGVNYTHYNKLDGSISNFNGEGSPTPPPPSRNPGDNDTTYVYTWIAF
jgi:hypothetical protein